MKNQNLIKGNRLEDAIEQIEKIIFKTTPSFREAEIKFEKKKIIIISGVRHEIDLFAEINQGKGYKATYIFECKNWKKPVGKNEIIIFEKKIELVSAQKGFFVARKFTRDASNFADKQKRIELIEVDTDFVGIKPFPNLQVQTIHHNKINVVLSQYQKDKDAKLKRKIALDIKKDIVVFNGKELALQQFANNVAEKFLFAIIQKDKIKIIPNNLYTFPINELLNFKRKELYFKKIEIASIKIVAETEFASIRPGIITKFDVKSRGRVINFETVKMKTGKLDISMAATR